MRSSTPKTDPPAPEETAATGSSLRRNKLSIRDLTLFAIFAAITLASQIALYGIPGVQFVGLFIASFTLVYRIRALIPIYVYVLLYLLFYGFFGWNLPYLYVFLPLWGMFMLAGKVSTKTARILIFVILCGLCVLFYLLFVMIFMLEYSRFLYILLPLTAVFALFAWKLPPGKARGLLFMFLCGLFGLSFGTLYAPSAALTMGFDFRQTVAWIISGLPTDITHAVNNFATGILIIPLTELLKKLESERENL